jgi:cyclic beta-1,2-glucan synthetase
VTEQLEFFNGFGGFARGGREYEIHLGDGRCTPAPWVNVIANPQLGFVVSESGASFTWALNSHENQLTPWSNDPVCDTSGEVVYLLDEDTGNLWTPTALPLRDSAVDHVTSHGIGYSRFRARSGVIASELTQFVVESDPIKISRLRLHNSSSRAKSVLVTFYCDWVLGATREGASPHVVTELDERSGVMLARNPWSEEFGERVAFVDMQGKQTQWTADRTEFLGRHGSLRRPRALMLRSHLSGRTGVNMDPCCAMQTSVIVPAFETAEVVCVTGQGNNRDDALRLAARYRALHPAQLLAGVSQQWEEVLGKVNITTPDRGFDIIMNNWALYQTLSCRMYARAGFYQAGGAYGFRDQLQDCMALVYSVPQLAREHLLRAAARQFEEGDVQHWWHPPGGRGVRTRISDDRLWLASATAHYVKVTDDQSVLNELVRFLTGPALVDSHDVYFEPGASDRAATLFEHCARALDASLRVGDHGLPLMGGGDWNDGMNRVGAQGKGESVWLAWFLVDTLTRFAPLAVRRGESQRAQRWSIHAQRLRDNLEEYGWDGAWYRRAYFDDGSTLGSAADAECRIDSIVQSWSVLSGGAPRARAERAMRAVTEHLVRRGDGLTVLFAPPFSGVRDAGYISAYPPGVRENGGQYTHAAVWCWRAYAELGNREMVAELLETLNPIHRTATRAGVHVYRCEPYVFAGDIYSEPPYVRRGGWSWYTGAAGWFYRSGLESVLGIQVEGATMTVHPCVPQSWQNYTVSYQYGRSRYVIRVRLEESELFSTHAGSRTIDLIDDGEVHDIQISCIPQIVGSA